MKQEQGISSIEVLIASAITIIMLAGTMSTLNRSFGVSEQTTMLADLDQNMRAGMNYLVNDFMNAGWGIPTGGIPIPSGATADPVRRPGPPESVLTFASETLAAVNPGAGLGPEGNGRTTDIVNILYADSLLALNRWQLTGIVADGGGSSITVDPRTPIVGIDNPVREGDLIALSNANGSTLQYVTGVNGQNISFNSGDALRLNQPNAAQGSIAQLNNNGVFPPTTATRVLLITYYLDYAVDPDMPRLIRRINNAPGQPIALVLEDLQLTYDLVDRNLNPTGVDTPTGTNSPNQIRKANIFLTGRSSSKVRSTDDFMRRTLTTQVSLRSLSFVDRYR
jgi:hypothetical protein